MLVVYMGVYGYGLLSECDFAVCGIVFVCLCMVSSVELGVLGWIVVGCSALWCSGLTWV